MNIMCFNFVPYFIIIALLSSSAVADKVFPAQISGTYNSGTYKVNSQGTTIRRTVNFSGDVTVKVDGKSLDVYGGLSCLGNSILNITNSGKLNVSSSRGFYLSGNATMNVKSSGGSVKLSKGNISVSGAAKMNLRNGTSTVSAGKVRLTGGITTMSGGTVTLTGGTTTLSDGSVMNLTKGVINVLSHTSGTTKVTAKVNLTGGTTTVSGGYSECKVWNNYRVGWRNESEWGNNWRVWFGRNET